MAIPVDGPKRLEFVKDRDQIMRMAGTDVAFKAEGSWARPKARNRATLLRKLLQTDQVAPTAHLRHGGARWNKRVTFRTWGRAQAYAALKEGFQK